MSVVPVSSLNFSDLAILGNNLLPAARSERRRDTITAVNRSLAVHREQVATLFRVRPKRAQSRVKVPSKSPPEQLN